MRRVRESLLAAVQGLVVSIGTLAVSITLFVLAVVSISFILLGVGVFTTPPALAAVRLWADQRRVTAHRWAGIRIPSAYRPLPPEVRGGVVGQVERCIHLLKDPATWRDLQWLLVDMTAGFVTALLPAALLSYGVLGFVVVAGLWRVWSDWGGNWFGFVHVTDQASAAGAAALGAALIALSLVVNPALLRAHFRMCAALLSPTKASLAQRVEHLTATRHDAVDSSAAELRRIERDLHDGAQARLVAMGMSLGTIEALLEKDPAQAKALLATARESSAEALTELRDLVRGIHPPVLAERGLGDAVRALALRMPVAVEVSVELTGRAEAPLESAAYFAVSEVLTNAAKYAEAERVWIDIHHDAPSGMLRMAVTDNGRGGASLSPDGGLAGVERRLGTFDGILAVSSPPGGPTMVTMEIPCRLN
ncbi:sensor domain-containing protein [Streptomyces sp. NPDC048639]|uniref:sensor histidine kinase n=1 Tax=Streptomyces sp. NPDC048639 TaxID=3365581 RepID=UPI00371058DF